ncbi:MAG: leucine-rich repeat protein, partial [Spirochaetaceae bacterium]|nr:leucine-rich repeat protein [Spirochaetaceae bacterium]
MKKFLQIFALCALCVLAAPMVFAQNDDTVIIATKDNVIKLLQQHVKDGFTIELIGEIDEDTIRTISDFIVDRYEYSTKPKINLDMSKATGLKNIPFEAFRYCANLESIKIPSSIENIDDYAFRDCDSLIEIIVDEHNENFKSVDGVLYSKDCSVLVCYPKSKNGKSFILPAEVNNIRKDAFCGFINLEGFLVNENNENYKAVEGV